MSHDRRLSRLEHLLWEKLRAAEEGCADDLRVAAERRIVRGEAGPDDFQTMLASDLGRRQAGLVRDANSYYRDRVTRWVAPPLDPFDPYSPPPGPPPRPDTAAMSTRSFGLEILATPIHEPYPRRLYEELLRRAEGPRQTARFTDLPMKMSSELRARAAVVPPPE
jgi:hypothetical protein